MKQNTKDYDIFKDLEPFDISKYISQHVTTDERNKLKLTESVHVGGSCYGTREIFKDKCIYNTTLKTAQTYDYYHHVWVDVPPATIKPMHNGYGNDYHTNTYYGMWLSEITKKNGFVQFWIDFIVYHCIIWALNYKQFLCLVLLSLLKNGLSERRAVIYGKGYFLW